MHPSYPRRLYRDEQCSIDAGRRHAHIENVSAAAAAQVRTSVRIRWINGVHQLSTQKGTDGPDSNERTVVTIR